MEIDVTRYVTEFDCSLFSNSVANSGLDNIGQITWNNAKQHCAIDTLVTPEQQDELRDWIRDFGAWDDEEIAEMGDEETNALLLQFIAGDIQEMERFETYEEYQEAAEQGQVTGRLWRASDEDNAPNGTWYYYIGN